MTDDDCAFADNHRYNMDHKDEARIITSLAVRQLIGLERG